MSKPLRCRLGWHRWVTTYASDGTTRYLKCQHCATEDDFSPRQFWMGE